MAKHLSLFIALAVSCAVSAQRVKYNFNTDWKVFVGDATGAEAPAFDDASWKTVTLPYAWNEDDAFRKDIRDHSTSISWYRKKFRLPASAKGQKVFIEFEGIRQAGDFYVNGKHVGIHENGVTAFGFDGLPVYLDRGPTPLTPSIRSPRVMVNIAKATAGANADSVQMSFDDNELSDWVNDGNLSTAWVEYELERLAGVSEICLKLNNFRSRSYPLRITVDGKEVFNGNTPLSLGYATLRFNHHTGKKVRIELAGASKESGGNQMAEVSGKKLDDGVARDDAKAKGTLSIIEVEIYEPLKQKR